MNPILIRYLISLFLLNFSYTDGFQDWLQDNKNKLKLPTQVSFKAKIVTNDTDISEQKEESCHLFLDASNNIYQLQILNNIIYYDGNKTDRYNSYSEQLFRYKTDELLSDVIDKIISDDYFFDISKYDSLGLGTYEFKIDNNILNIHFSDGENINIYYRDNSFNCEFYDIDIKILDNKSFNDSLLYSKIDTTSIHSKNNFFNFIK